MQFTPPLQRAGEISELRLQHSVAFFSFVLGALGALHSVMIEAMCDNPSQLDDFLTLLWSEGPHIVLKRHRTDSSQMPVRRPIC